MLQINRIQTSTAQCSCQLVMNIRLVMNVPSLSLESYFPQKHFPYISYRDVTYHPISEDTAEVNGILVSLMILPAFPLPYASQNRIRNSTYPDASTNALTFTMGFLFIYSVILPLTQVCQSH